MDVVKVSWVDGVVFSVDVVELTGLGWGSVVALHPLVILVPEAGGDVQLRVNGSLLVRKVNNLSRVSTVLGHLLADDLPVVLLDSLALSTSLGKTEAVHVRFGPSAEFNLVGDGVLRRFTDLEHIDGVKFTPFDGHSQGRDASEDSSGKRKKRESTHNDRSRV